MKHLFLATIFFISINLFGQSQTKENTSVDSALVSRISISGFCLCQNTLTNLKTLDNNLKEVKVEEMDTPKDCFALDSRYINGQGYSSDNYSGMIFQKEEDSDYISKIRLTKDFKGILPNGTFIDMTSLKLNDIFIFYPEFKDKWGSRGCSDYWKFSNDTISFYVKIDKKIQPQFPINETYYLDKPIEAVDLVISCYSVFNKSIKILNEPTNEPIIYLDKIHVNTGVLSLYDPNEIAAVEVYKDTTAIKMVGNEGKNGLIYVTTKKYARECYWTYFKSKSDVYSKVVSSLKNEKNIIYILNNKILEKDYEGDLYFIDDSNFIDLSVIDKEQLEKDYSIKNKKYGIVIRTNTEKKE